MGQLQVRSLVGEPGAMLPQQPSHTAHADLVPVGQLLPQRPRVVLLDQELYVFLAQSMADLPCLGAALRSHARRLDLPSRSLRLGQLPRRTQGRRARQAGLSKRLQGADSNGLCIK